LTGGVAPPRAAMGTVRAITTTLRRLSLVMGMRRLLWSAVGAGVGLPTLTFVLASLRQRVSLTIVFLVYQAAVVVLSAAGGPVVGLCSAVAAFLAVNWFFTEPLHTLNVSDPERVAELMIFLAVSGTVASLVSRSSRRREVLEVTTARNEELAAANDVRTALLRAVSHDLRTPLTTAKLATSSLLAQDVVWSDEQRQELVGLANTEIDRLVGIVENLLDASRLQAGALNVLLEATPVVEVVERALEELPAPQRALVVVDLSPALPPVEVDGPLLERVVVNLLANALTADPGRPVVVRASTEGETGLVLEVVDHGPGLSAEQRKAAILPFHRYEDRGWSSGIGLGLAICAGFCQAMGGRLELADTTGGGLTARVVLEREL
jgi:K+-sensing histidine kinase KdpD